MGAGKGGNLPVTCQTFLKEWYSGDREEIHSKYLHKGNLVEIDLIDFMAEQLQMGFVEKNTVTMHNEYMVGTCDVLGAHCVFDTKASWSRKTLLDSAVNGLNSDYEWQGRGYMCLYDRPNFVVFHGLMNTPEECTYGDGEIVYDDLPANERWVAFRIQRDVTIEQEIIARVIECRKWLADYHQKIIATLGKVH